MSETKNKKPKRLLALFSRVKNMTISKRITLLFTSMFSVILIVVCGIALYYIASAYRRSSEYELRQTASVVAAHIESGGDISEEVINYLNPHANVRIGITAMESNLAFELPYELVLPFPIDVYTDDLEPGQTIIVQAVRYMFDEKIAVYDGRPFSIRVYRNYEHENEIIRILIMMYGVIVLLGTLGAYFLGKLITRITLGPIRQITQTAERIGIEDLSQRIEMDGPDDEIKELAVTFNDMISRLEASFHQQEQFVADASHELRTPISVIQGYANLLDRWGKHDMAIMQESIDSIITETERMNSLVKKLLFMAKAENNMIQVSKEPIQLKQVVEEVVKEMGLTNKINPVRLYSNGNDVIHGSYDLIKQLLWIFTENAIKYSKTPKDYVSIKVYSRDTYVYINVSDKGIGISEEDLPHIFERFYRADKSRTNQTKAPGSGLGLSIASWILRQHDASIKVRSKLGQGTEILVRFKAVDKKEFVLTEGKLLELNTESENLKPQVVSSS